MVSLQRGFEIPSFNFVTEKESVKGRTGSIAKARYLNHIEFELPLIIRNGLGARWNKKLLRYIKDDLIFCINN